MKLALSNIAVPEGQERTVYALLGKYGFTGLEAAPTRLVGQQPYAQTQRAAALAKALREEYGLCIPSLQSIWYGRTENIFDENGAAALLAYTQQTVLFAQAVGCRSLVLGCPRNRNMPQGAQPQQALGFFTRISAFAAQHGAAVALEANPPVYNTNFVNTTAQAFAFASQVPHCMVNYDMGTCLINNEDFSAVEQNAALLSHVHISEPQLALIDPAHRDKHEALAQLLRRSGYTHYVSVEMKAQPVIDIERTLDYIREVFA